MPKDPAEAVLAGYVVTVGPETGRKENRAEPVAAQAGHGNLLIRRALWNESLVGAYGAPAPLDGRAATMMSSPFCRPLVMRSSS